MRMKLASTTIPMQCLTYVRKGSYMYTQEDLIIVDGELIIHRRAYLRIQRLAKSYENTKKISKIKGNSMVVVSFDFIGFLYVFVGFRQSLYP